MTDDIIITTPTLKDVDTLVSWGENNWQLWGSQESKWYDKKALTQWINDPRDDIQLVARINGQLVGMCFTHVMCGWALCDGLYVTENFRSRGIGKLLIDKTTEILKTKPGVGNLSLLCDFENESGYSFYKSQHFSAGMKFIWMEKNFK
jgi:GNAT superfamily N-acetyltransferase